MQDYNEIREQLNEQESRELELQAKLSKSDRAALEYVKTLSGFKKMFPEHAAEIEEAQAEKETLEAQLEETKAEWCLHIGEAVSAGDVIVHKGVRYTVIQDHVLQADWEPDSVPALYHKEGAEPTGDDPVDEWPEFVQPTGAHDAYAKGAKVTYKGVHYVSLIDNNAYSPEAYPAGWQAQE